MVLEGAPHTGAENLKSNDLSHKLQHCRKQLTLKTTTRKIIKIFTSIATHYSNDESPKKMLVSPTLLHAQPSLFKKYQA
jgi:hypothetical protein